MDPSLLNCKIKPLHSFMYSLFSTAIWLKYSFFRNATSSELVPADLHSEVLVFSEVNLNLLSPG